MLDPQLQNAIEAGVNVGFDAVRIEEIIEEKITGDLLVTHLAPIHFLLGRRVSLRIENDDDHGQDLIHALLVAVVGIFASPQVQDLRK